MGTMLCGGMMLVLISGTAIRAGDPPKEIQDKVKAFEQSVQKSSAFSEELKKAITAGALFYGRPYFIGAADGAGAGAGGYFMFWLFNANEKPTYRFYSISTTTPGGQALMKTVLFAFEQKVQWVAVYQKADDRDGRVLHLTVYP